MGYQPYQTLGVFAIPLSKFIANFFGWAFQFQNLMVFQVEGTYIAYWTQKLCLLVKSKCLHFSKIFHKNEPLKEKFLQKLFSSSRFNPWSPALKVRALPLYYGAMDEATNFRFYCYCERVWQKGPPPLGLNRVKHTLGIIGFKQLIGGQKWV